MATAEQVVRAIGQEILEQASEAPLEAPETQDIIFAMNNYMTELDADGVSLGYTLVSNLGDTITIAAGAINGLIKNVAMYISPQFDIPVSAELAMQARRGLRIMTHLGLNLQPAKFPSTLPIGSGNEFDDFNSQHFYPGEDETILTENNQNILLEDQTP